MPKETQEKIPSGQQRGVVVMFDAERGFGFIRPDGVKEEEEKDVFVHVRNVEGHKSLHPGQRVSFHLTRTDKGPAAINVQAGSVLGIPYLKYSLIGLGTALLLLFGLASAMNRPTSFALWLMMWVSALSLVTFGIYGYDKAQAQNNGPRVPEAVLHLLGLLGGTPGAFIAMRMFHHKTSKQSFLTIFWIIVAVQLAALAILLLTRFVL
jgi:uncharacterized membrane protein YsdA (DUF1294 family)/cold shock CspA family protein